ncbi:leucine rich repeat domain protein [Mariannaea sp. PMI_226]|nr:leucine rich repeat domain protein [Mariannaea sp. PMI_226]
MESLPSYHEATSRPDWLALAVPFVPPCDYPAACLVNRRFWSVFAPRLWSNVLRTVRRAGLQSGDDLTWWLNFIFAQLSQTRQCTRVLTGVLDAREFGRDSHHFALGQQEGTLNQSFKQAISLFPNLTCILLDGHSQLDPNTIFGTGTGSGAINQRLLLLSIANLNCPAPLPNSFFSYPGMRNLVYLDVSGIPGSIRNLVSSQLHDLRILKVRNREVDDAAFCELVLHFGSRLWSLDVGNNKISDTVVQMITSYCFSGINLQSEAYFRVEGMLEPAQGGIGAKDYGLFTFVEESQWSGSFSHPERYLIDSPMYIANAESGLQEYQAFRSDGQARPKPDSADAVLRAFSGEDLRLSLESYHGSWGLTHLNLSDNQMSSFGIERLLRESKGRLEKLTCDYMPLVTPPKTQSQLWPKSAKLFGILNAAYFVRPVFSSNLRTLRLHHSFVTQIPTLEMDGLSALSRLYIAETSILPRSKQAYPQSFVPDMNPRLTSLTLTHIPRRSSGPLISGLVQFLKLLSTQERAITEAKSASSLRREPGILDGLRHLRLEFDLDPRDEGFSPTEGLDAEELMNAGEQGFSFFDDASPKHRRASSSNPFGSRQERSPGGALISSRNDESDRAAGDFLTHHGEWNGETCTVSVWIGPESPSHNTILNDYRRLVLNHHVRDQVGPATASQVIAGAPSKSFIFQTAWCLAVMPSAFDTPAWTDLMNMRDVLEELKRFRLAARARYADLKTHTPHGQTARLGEPHFFWTGKLEVARVGPVA